MKPSIKSTEIRELMDTFVGASTEQSIESNHCIPPPIGCGRPITPFRDKLSEQEYQISGLCQACQDKIF